jgi:hypothetical protein
MHRGLLDRAGREERNAGEDRAAHRWVGWLPVARQRVVTLQRSKQVSEGRF